MLATLAVLLLFSSSAWGATSGASASTLRYEAQPTDQDGSLRLLWEGEVGNNGVDELEARVVIRLRGPGGEELQTCNGEPFRLGRLERTVQQVTCPVPGERWSRVEALLVRVDVQVGPTAPEEEPDPAPEAADAPAGAQGPSARQKRLERDLAASEARLANAEKQVAEATAEVQEKTDDYQAGCVGTRGKPPRDSARCEKLQAQMDRLQKDLARLREKLEDAQREVEKDRERLREAAARAGG